jgi:hypothetical protein
MSAHGQSEKLRERLSSSIKDLISGCSSKSKFTPNSCLNIVDSCRVLMSYSHQSIKDHAESDGFQGRSPHSQKSRTLPSSHDSYHRLSCQLPKNPPPSILGSITEGNQSECMANIENCSRNSAHNRLMNDIVRNPIPHNLMNDILIGTDQGIILIDAGLAHVYDNVKSLDSVHDHGDVPMRNPSETFGS